MPKLGKEIQASERVSVLSDGSIITTTLAQLKYVYEEGTRCLQRYFISDEDKTILDLIRNLQWQLKEGASSRPALPEVASAESICAAAAHLLDFARTNGYELAIAPTCTVTCSRCSCVKQVNVTPVARGVG